MDDNREDDEFLQQFMARAKKREAKLAEIGEPSEPKTSNRDVDVSYPPLSPLPEEQDNDEEETGTNISVPVDSGELDYSSDLSLDCDQEVYRAEPVMCHSSPSAPMAPLQEVKHQQLLLYETMTNQANHRHHSDQQLPPHQQQVQQQQQQQTRQHRQQPSLRPRHNVEELKASADRADHTRIQLKKAVEVSKHGSKEHIEAARLLQITENEHLAFSQRAAKLELGDYQAPKSYGSLKLSHIELRMSSKLRNELADDGVSHYFLCIASCGTSVKATEVVDTNSIRKQDIKAYLQFKEPLLFDDLPPDFNLKLEVFELIIGQHLPKLLSRLTPSKTKRSHPNGPEYKFRRVGSLKLTLADRKETYKKLTHWSDSEKSKYIESECKFRIELRSEQLPTKSGMLNIRTLDQQGRPDWIRTWVEFTGTQLKYWKSQQDSRDGRSPNEIIDIGSLCLDHVQQLTPNDVSYRKHSFVLYSLQRMVGGDKNTFLQRKLKEDPNYKIMRHQYAADNKEDKESWCEKLDRAMSCYREWHGSAKLFGLEAISKLFYES